jgi:hypothetical protein
VLSTTCDSASCVKMARNRKIAEAWIKRVGCVGDDSHVVKRGRCRDATASSFVATFRAEDVAHFHAVTAKRHSSMWNWLFGLPGWIHCVKSPWCQRKWWVCSWLCSCGVLPFFGLPWTDHAIQKPAYCSCFIPKLLV